MFKHLFDIKKKIRIQQIRMSLENHFGDSFGVARFDELHPVVSGNKFFKLKYNIIQALNENKRGIITMGGAFSNHLAATACICKHLGIKSIGIIRGELPSSLNHTLAYCVSQNMQLIPVERNQFNEHSAKVQHILKEHENYFFIPMGGANENGIKGAEEMMDMIPEFEDYDIIICAMGSGTMFKGLQRKIQPHQQLIGIPVMKIQDTERFAFLKHYDSLNKIKIYTEFAGKGYGKADENIVNLINAMYDQHKLPLDFVYTGKLIHALFTLFENKEIEENKKVLAIHSGGLQGNESLPQSTLIF